MLVIVVKGEHDYIVMKRLMDREKNNVNSYVSILLLVFMAYSLIIFLFVREMNSFFWCSFVLTTVIFIFQILMNEYTVIKGIELKGTLFNMPIISIGIIFMSIQIIYAIFFSFIDVKEYTILFIVQFSTFAVYCATVITSLLYSIKLSEKEPVVRSYTDDIAANIKNIESNAGDLNSRVIVHQLYEKIMKSNPNSPKEAVEIEIQIQNKVVNLNKIIDTCDSDTLKCEVRELNNLFEERNRICRMRLN